MRKHGVIDKTGSSERIACAVRGGPSVLRPQATCTANLAKVGRVVSRICVRTDRQTDAYHSIPPLTTLQHGRGVHMVV